jgi:hypothetical protein
MTDESTGYCSWNSQHQPSFSNIRISNSSFMRINNVQ